MKKIFSKTFLTILGFLALIVFGVMYGYSIIKNVNQPPEPTDLSQYVETVNGIQTYSQTFESPIDPALQSETHELVYETIASITHFDIEYPTELPEGFTLVSVDATEGEPPMSGIGDDYYGLNTTTYENDSGAKIEVLQGYVDLGFFPEDTEYPLHDGVYARKWPEAWGHGFTIYTIGEESSMYLYHVIGDGVTDEQLLDVAKSLKTI